MCRIILRYMEKKNNGDFPVTFAVSYFLKMLCCNNSEFYSYSVALIAEIKRTHLELSFTGSDMKYTSHYHSTGLLYELAFDRYVKAILAKHSFTCYSSLANKRTHRHVCRA